jgi:hypothetical protein
MDDSKLALVTIPMYTPPVIPVKTQCVIINWWNGHHPPEKLLEFVSANVKGTHSKSNCLNEIMICLGNL